MNYYTITNRLAYIRKKRCLTQTQLSEIVGVSKNMISSYELGTAFPNVIMALKLSQALNVAVSTIWDISFK